MSDVFLDNTKTVEIQPVSEIKFQPEEKTYELKPNTYDIGEFLNLLKILPYQKIIIRFKEGNYNWDVNFIMPENTSLYLYGENNENGGYNNKVTIIINKKNTKIYQNKEYSLNTRLQIKGNCYCQIFGIDIIEKINDSRPRYSSSDSIGVFNLISEYSTSHFSLSGGRFEISSSPFINVGGNNSRGRIDLNYCHFKKNSFASESEVIIIDQNSGWNGRGSLAEVFKTLTDVQDCKFLTDKKTIIYYES
jgi:hypothetical protein